MRFVVILKRHAACFGPGMSESPRFAYGAFAICLAAACSGSGTRGDENTAALDGGPATADDASFPAPTPSADGGAPGVGSRDDSGAPGAVDASVPPTEVADTGVPAWDGGGYPSGWLYTTGGKIYVSNGGSPATQWMGRGVNIDDIFFCGYNNTLSMGTPDKTLETVVSGLMSAWKPNFVRISLGMNSYSAASFLKNDAQYKTPMTNVINAIGAYPHVHVLVTLRSDKSMIGEVPSGDSEATGLPSDSTTSPDKTAYPTGTDAVYVALVDTFASSSFVMFGLTNEPGGNTLTNEKIAAAMDHAVGVIRAEEDRLKVPHHIVSVQGNGWSSDISFYAKTPALITRDNVVYEVHGYPPPTSGYTYPSVPVILGEYGSLTSSTSDAFYADIESKQIPNLAWDFDSYSNCSPDLLNVNHSASMLMPTDWGTIVQKYLLLHASP